MLSDAGSVEEEDNLSPESCQWEDVTSPLAGRVRTLKKQLTMETKVKQGAENIIHTYTNSSVKVHTHTHTHSTVSHSVHTVFLHALSVALTHVVNCWQQQKASLMYKEGQTEDWTGEGTNKVHWSRLQGVYLGTQQPHSGPYILNSITISFYLFKGPRMCEPNFSSTHPIV